MKVMTVFGTRPEAIKMCPVIRELNSRKNIESVVCLTGQHREMLDQVMDVFDIHSHYDLNIMKENQTLASISSSMTNELDAIYIRERPDIVLVHGDTTSSFVAAQCAFYRHIMIGHVEAGLRTYNMQSPFPEEFNRQGVDLISDLFFAPTEKAKENLISEGKPEEKIFVTGNTVIDALKITVSAEYYHELFEWLGKDRLILLTAHRRENLGQPMEQIFKAIKKIIETISDIKVIYPIHKNPRVREIADSVLAGCERIKIIEPMDVFDFHNFMKKSYLIMTDSGGIQEEAPSLGIPVLVLRDTTERPEGVKAGTLKLTGTDKDTIYREAMKLITDNDAYQRMSKAVNPYGDGHASKRIVDNVVAFIERTNNA